MPDFNVTELDAGVDFDNLDCWDVVIIGAGPAGLAASLTTAHRGLTTLVVEGTDKPGGQPQFLYADKKIVDIPGFPDGITGEELSERTFRQAVNARVQFRFQEELVALEDTDQTMKDDPLKKVVTSRGSYLCRKVILACGLLHSPRKLPVIDRLESKRVYYKVPRINDYGGDRVAIVGGGDSALDAAVMILQRGGDVDVIIRDETPVGKASTQARVRELGGRIRTATEIAAARIDGAHIVLTLTQGGDLPVDRGDRADRFSVGTIDVRASGIAAERQRQHCHRPLFRDEPPRRVRSRRRARRHQADHRGLGRGDSGRDLRL